MPGVTIEAMGEIKVHLWANVPGGMIPTATFETEGEMEAAALALREFRTLGYDFSHEGAHVDIELPDGTIKTMLVNDVLAWLADPAQTLFAETENLRSLLQ
jgi:hypothetical protein